MTERQLFEGLRVWFAGLVERFGTPQEFAKATGIKQPVVSQVSNGKRGRRVTWDHIVKISETPGLPSAPEIFKEISHVLLDLPTEQRPLTQAQQLRERALSGEIRGRASAVARAKRQRLAPPAHPEPPAQAASSKSDRRG